MSDLLRKWIGVILAGIAVVATLVLGATGRLELYIHPRYVIFSVVMAVVGAALIAIAVWRHAGIATDHDHDHDHDHDEHLAAAPVPRARSRGPVAAVAGALLVLVAGGMLLVVPPASLSPERAMVATDPATVSRASGEAPVLVGSDSTAFTVKDWAFLIGQGRTATDFAAQRADVTGFILGADAPDSDVVYVARYMVTCCTVDAQPVAVPVTRDSLPDDIENGAWVRVRGAWADGTGQPLTRLIAASTEWIEEPSDPYVF